MEQTAKTTDPTETAEIQCTENEDCHDLFGNDYACVDGFCVFAAIICNSDEDCPGEQYCTYYHRCKEIPKEEIPEELLDNIVISLETEKDQYSIGELINLK